jgi:hypothetical protein
VLASGNESSESFCDTDVISNGFSWRRLVTILPPVSASLSSVRKVGGAGHQRHHRFRVRDVTACADPSDYNRQCQVLKANTAQSRDKALQLIQQLRDLELSGCQQRHAQLADWQFHPKPTVYNFHIPPEANCL